MTLTPDLPISGGGLSQDQVDARVLAIVPGRQKKVFSIAEMFNPTTFTCSVITSIADQASAGLGLRGFLFDHASAERVLFEWAIPESMDVSLGIDFKVHWSPVSTSTGIVRWEMRSQTLADNYAYANYHEGTDAFSDDAGNGVAYKHQISPSVNHSPAVITGADAGELIQFALYRRGDLAADTHNSNDALLRAVEIAYYTNALNDD